MNVKESQKRKRKEKKKKKNKKAIEKREEKQREETRGFTVAIATSMRSKRCAASPSATLFAQRNARKRQASGKGITVEKQKNPFPRNINSNLMNSVNL